MARLVRYVSLGALVCGSLILATMLIWAYSLDADFSGRYACCTQEAAADFHRQFWSKFFAGAKVWFVGCLGLAVTLAGRTALRAGWWILGGSIVLLFANFAFMGLHDWVGSTAFTITQVLFCSGVSLLIVGAIRVRWAKLHL
jgi:hypothetical protein